MQFCDNNNDDNISTIDVLLVLSNGNPGAATVLIELVNNPTYDSCKIEEFFIKLLDLKIIGARLWYIYKNECNKNLDEFIIKDLSVFDDNYFYEKIEKYI
jgi:hypothetical protein